MLSGSAHAWLMRLALTGAAVLAACESGDDAARSKLENATAAPAGPGGDTQASAAADAGRYDDTRALDWLKVNCASCHGLDPNTGTKAPYYSAWPLPAEGITRRFLETNELTANAYQTIRHAALIPSPTTPSPMPPGAVTDQRRSELRAMIDWFQRAVPFAVIDADARYGNDSPLTETGLVQFSCKNPSTLRAFLSRVTLGAFERPPTADELAWFPDAQLGLPVTPEQRQLVVSKLDGPWRDELIQIGLKKLATVIGGGPGIKPGDDITPEVAADLKDELYQSFVAHYDTANYDDYFSGNTVMASPNTASLYGCEVETGWKECPLEAPRGGFFTTLGFLNSKPSSFLRENNNYGRVAALYFTIFGEQLLADTNGPAGAEVPELPKCLEPTDTRMFQGAPRGTAAVPAFGRICQSCHLSRHMAAGSILFRSYSTTGRIYDPQTFGTEEGPDQALFQGAVGELWTYKNGTATGRVDSAFLTSLLTAPRQPCVLTGKPADPFVTVRSVSDLASQLMTNKSSFARGFMRHAQRAFANLPSITLEMGLRSLTAFDAGKKKLPDLVKTYFGTDSFACEADR
jgi:hypothetical protein